MEIGPLNPVGMGAPVDLPSTVPDGLPIIRQIVTAVRRLNESELLGQNRDLMFVRDPDTQQPVIQILERETGEVIDQIPPEALLRMMAALEQQQKENL